MRKSKVKILIAILITTAAILLLAIAAIVIGKKMLDERNAKISELEYELDANKRVAYVAIKDISAGESVEEGVNVEAGQIASGISQALYMTSNQLGSIARIDISNGEPIMKSDVTSLEITKDTREYEISVAALMTNQAEYDYVDVRIMFPNGEDYLVLSKKPVFNLALTECIFYSYLNEDEILRMASATVDAFTVTGTRIYTTRYVESNLQDDAIPNYPVKAETIDLINRDPNITRIATETLNLQARTDLESRLTGLTEEQLQAVAAGHSLEDTAKNSVIFNGTYYVEEGNYYSDQAQNMQDETSDGEYEEEASEPEEQEPEESAESYEVIE